MRKRHSESDDWIDGWCAEQKRLREFLDRQDTRQFIAFLHSVRENRGYCPVCRERKVTHLSTTDPAGWGGGDGLEAIPGDFNVAENVIVSGEVGLECLAEHDPVMVNQIRRVGAILRTLVNREYER